MRDVHLQPGEKPLADVRLSWLFVLNSFGALVAAIFTLGLSAWLQRRSTVLVVTDRRLILSRGVFERSVVEMELGRVAQVQVISGLLDRVWGIGRLRIIALDQFDFEMYPVSEPDRLKDLLMAAANAARRGTGLAPSRAPADGAPTASTDDPLGALERLGKMRDGGVLSEAEFQAKKSELLRRL